MRYVVYARSEGGVEPPPMSQEVVTSVAGSWAYPNTTTGYNDPRTSSNAALRKYIKDIDGYWIAYPYIDPAVNKSSSIFFLIGKWIVDNIGEIDLPMSIHVQWHGRFPNDHGDFDVAVFEGVKVADLTKNGNLFLVPRV